MKLRNKKTGRVVNFRCIMFDEPKDDRENYRYSSLAEFNDEWEDCAPKEPLIKDEKVRKAVRAWAEAESIPPDGAVNYNYDEYSLGWYHTVLEFSKHIQDLRDESEYTIAELCGEEEG